MKKIIIVIFCLIILTILTMGFFNKHVLFSEVNGVVTLNGKSIENAEIVQSYQWAWNDKKGTKTTKTDSNGKFKFDEINTSGGLSNLLPHEPYISQDIIVNFDGKSYKAWLFSKHDYDRNGELEKNINLEIELTNDLKHHDAVKRYDSNYYGIAIAK